ncbi:MAG: PIN domain-containing protein [Caulobacter sp.]|nr:PIN domain-containing protein [Caulobacter sp.]
MSDYLDTSLLVSLIVEDDHSSAALAYLELQPEVMTSGWAAAEFSSALGIQQRMGRITADDRAVAETRLDQWLSGTLPAAVLAADDATQARSLLRTIGTPLRAPDALHLVICRRLGATLASFDLRMVEAARELGLPVREL